ncbi:Hypothetical protein PBC10988_27850 [Planctomycetales bacterium 10988]|nr:Hypothetical protein PBC10988_27850 [Planctomycetales bacterium 10988]
MSTTQLTAEHYLKCLTQSGLVDEKNLMEEFGRFKQKVQDDPKVKPTINNLSGHFIEAGIITPWHHQQLMQGKHRGFFLGNYKLLEPLGKGGMGSVYLAEHTKMRRKCAVKILPKSRVKDGSYLDRFQGEARAIAAVDHPNIVQAYSFDVRGDVYFIAMQYVSGWDLQGLVEEHGPLDFDMAADYIRQSAEGLAHAHERGLVHRDIKPANLLVDEEGTVRILDLGLAKITETEEDSPTKKHNDGILGTADYLSPEQTRDSHNLDGRTDIYSLGYTLYFLLTGSAPFPEDSVAKKLLAHRSDEPQSIREFRPDTPDALVTLVYRMTRKEPDQRVQTAQQVADYLTSWLNSAEDFNEEEYLDAPAPAVSGQGKWLLGLIILVNCLIVALSIGGYMLLSSNEPDGPSIKDRLQVKTNTDTQEGLPEEAVVLVKDPPAWNLFRIFEEESDFAPHYQNSAGTLERVTQDSFQGDHALKVAGQEILTASLPNFPVEIQMAPAPGEFRYLRFAVKRTQAAAFYILLEGNGSVAPPNAAKEQSFRYRLGEPKGPFTAMSLSGYEHRRDWVEITCDLAKDFGDFRLSGIGFGTVAGSDGEEVLIDHLYLARSRADFDQIPFYSIGQQAAIAIQCGLEPEEAVRVDREYTYELSQGTKQHNWEAPIPYTHSWQASGPLEYELSVPSMVQGDLQMIMVSGDQKIVQQTVSINDKDKGTFARTPDGYTATIPVASLDSLSGKLKVKVTPPEGEQADLSVIKFLPKYRYAAFPEEVITDYEVVYLQPNRDLKMDIFQPPKPRPPLPLVILLPSSGENWYRAQMSRLARDLVERDFVVAILSYRHSSEGDFKDIVRDVKTGIRFLRDNAGKYQIEKDKIGVVGIESGANIAGILGVKRFRDGIGIHKDEEYDDVNDNVQAVVALEAVFDLDKRPKENDPLAPLFGTTRSDYLPSADLLDRLEMEGNNNVLPPFLIFQNLNDQKIPFEQTKAFASKFREIGGSVEMAALNVPSEDGSLSPLLTDEKYHTEGIARIETFFERTLKGWNTIIPEAGWYSIFDGETLAGWAVNQMEQRGQKGPSVIVQNGSIVMKGGRSHLFYWGPVSDHDFHNFLFEAEIKLESDQAESGIFFHTRWQPQGELNQGTEIVIHEQENDEYKTGSIARVKPVSKSYVRPGQWFHLRLTVENKTVKVSINGNPVMSYQEPAELPESTPRIVGGGTIALKSSANPRSIVHFRSIRVKPLTD